MPIDETCTNIDGKQRESEEKNYENLSSAKFNVKFSVVDEVVELKWFGTRERVGVFPNVVRDLHLCNRKTFGPRARRETNAYTLAAVERVSFFISPLTLSTLLLPPLFFSSNNCVNSMQPDSG